MKRTFAVIGGDTRQEYLARLLAADGHPTVTFGFEDATQGVPLAQAAMADCVVLPLPLSRETGLLQCRERVELEELWQMLRPGRFLCGGQVSAETQAAAAAHGLDLVDYFQREELTVVNAVPVALAVLPRFQSAAPAVQWYFPLHKQHSIPVLTQNQEEAHHGTA